MTHCGSGMFLWLDVAEKTWNFVSARPSLQQSTQPLLYMMLSASVVTMHVYILMSSCVIVCPYVLSTFPGPTAIPPRESKCVGYCEHYHKGTRRHQGGCLEETPRWASRQQQWWMVLWILWIWHVLWILLSLLVSPPNSLASMCFGLRHPHIGK